MQGLGKKHIVHSAENVTDILLKNSYPILPDFSVTTYFKFPSVAAMPLLENLPRCKHSAPQVSTVRPSSQPWLPSLIHVPLQTSPFSCAQHTSGHSLRVLPSLEEHAGETPGTPRLGGSTALEAATATHENGPAFMNSTAHSPHSPRPRHTACLGPRTELHQTQKWAKETLTEKAVKD